MHMGLSSTPWTQADLSQEEAAWPGGEVGWEVPQGLHEGLKQCALGGKTWEARAKTGIKKMLAS